MFGCADCAGVSAETCRFFHIQRQLQTYVTQRHYSDRRLMQQRVQADVQEVSEDIVGPRRVAVRTFTRSHPEQQGSEGASFRAGEAVIPTETPRLFVSLPHKRRLASGTGTGQLAKERVNLG